MSKVKDFFSEEADEAEDDYESGDSDNDGESSSARKSKKRKRECSKCVRPRADTSICSLAAALMHFLTESLCNEV